MRREDRAPICVLAYIRIHVEPSAAIIVHVFDLNSACSVLLHMGGGGHRPPRLLAGAEFSHPRGCGWGWGLGPVAKQVLPGHLLLWVPQVLSVGPGCPDVVIGALM